MPGASPVSSPSPEQAPALDLHRLADQVTRVIVRRFEIERERRGARKW
jgi:hypothetical protein